MFTCHPINTTPSSPTKSNTLLSLNPQGPLLSSHSSSINNPSNSNTMPLSKRKFTVRRHPVIVDVGCSCRRSKLSYLFSSIPKPKKPHHYFSTSTSTTPSATTTASSSSFSFQEDSPQKPTTRPSSKKKNPKGRLVGDSVAIEKDSSEPYLDFRESMVQMIVENQIYGWDELRELLHHLLSLNSPQYHPLILRAFSDVCQAIFSHPSP